MSVKDLSIGEIDPNVLDIERYPNSTESPYTIIKIATVNPEPKGFSLNSGTLD